MMFSKKYPVSPQKVYDYIMSWTEKIAAKGGYAEKQKVKKLSPK